MLKRQHLEAARGYLCKNCIAIQGLFEISVLTCCTLLLALLV